MTNSVDKTIDQVTSKSSSVCADKLHKDSIYNWFSRYENSNVKSENSKHFPKQISTRPAPVFIESQDKLLNGFGGKLNMQVE